MSLFMRTNYPTDDGRNVCVTLNNDGSVTIAVGDEACVPLLVTIAPKILSPTAVARLAQTVVAELNHARVMRAMTGGGASC